MSKVIPSDVKVTGAIEHAHVPMQHLDAQQLAALAWNDDVIEAEE